MNWDNIVLVGLVLLLGGTVGYALLSDQSFIVGDMSAQEMVEEEGLRDLPTLPVLGRAPDVQGIGGWINTEPLANADLRGKVVLVDFWTYSCINCIRTFPYVQGWHERYGDHGFVLLGVHTPEFSFEEKRENVEQAAAEYGLTYPIAQDNDYATWEAFRNRYWPAHYLIDVAGNIRYVHFGEGKYGETEAAIQSLLVEAGLADASDFDGSTKEEVVDHDVSTPELYLGYRRITENFGSGSSEVRPDEPYTFFVPDDFERNRWYLDGEWRIGPEASELTGPEGSIVLNWRAREANMVLEADEPVEVEVVLDGQPVSSEEAGDDVVVRDGTAIVTVHKSRLYHLIDAPESTWRILELRVRQPGLRAYTFTFG